MPYDILTVRIMHCDYSHWWYYDFVGLTIDVVFGLDDYIVFDDYLLGHNKGWRHIEHDDCMVINIKQFQLDS